MSPSAHRRVELLGRMRRVRLFLYLVIAACGYYAIAYPPSVLLDAATRNTAVVCAAFWAVGGTWCTISVLRHSVGGEYLWLRPLSIAVCAFALALISEVPERGPALGVYAMLLLGFGVSLWGWFHLVNGLIGPLTKEAGRGPADG